jgi:tetratricopeptide (TPR) repeat protein
MNKYIKYLIAVIVILIIVFISSISLNAAKKKAQKEALDRLPAIVAALEKYDRENDPGKAQINKIIDDVDAILKKVYEPEGRAEVLSVKGEALGLARRVIKAEDVFNQAFSLDANNYRIRMRYALLYYNNKEYDKVIELLNKALSKLPTDEKRDVFLEDKIKILYYIADVFEKKGDLSRVQIYYKQVVEISDKSGIENDMTKKARKILPELEKE